MRSLVIKRRGGERVVDYSEKDIEEELMDCPGLWKQLGIRPLANQVQVDHGIIDILGYEPKTKDLIVIELKKGLVDESAVGQIMRYMADIGGLKNWIDNNPDLSEEYRSINKVHGILMGTDCTPDVEAIVKSFPYLDFYQIHMKLDVIIGACYSNGSRTITKTIESFMDIDPLPLIEWAHKEMASQGEEGENS